METEAPTRPTLLSAEQLVDLRRRVLANEPVSDEELKLALESLAQSRQVAGGATEARRAKADPVYQPKGSLAERMAAFQQKKQLQ